MLFAVGLIVVLLGLYFALGFRRFALLVLIPGVIGLGIYSSWYYLSGQHQKAKLAEKQKLTVLHKKEHASKSAEELWRELVYETRRIESNARLGYHYKGDPDNTSPLGVWRFKAPEYDILNDEDLILKIRDRYYPAIPKERFELWARDPFGQEKIDASLEGAEKAK